MRRHIQLWGTRTLALALVVLGVHFWGMPLYRQYFTPKRTTVYVPTTKARQGPFSVSFHEIGSLEAERSVVVSTEVGGKIISLIKDGVFAKPGDKIAVFDTSDLVRELRNQQLTYQNALAEVERAKSDLEILRKSNETEVKQSEAQLEFDKAERDRAAEQLNKKKRLVADKLVPGDQVDQADLDLRAKELAVKKGEMSLVLKMKEVESKEKQKLSEVAKVQFAADIAKAGLEEVQNKMKRAVLTAPRGGLVVTAKDWTPEGRRKLQEGDSLRPRQDVCTLPDLSNMLVKVQVGEADVPKVKLGVPVKIRLEAVPNKVFHGTVKDIASLAAETMPWESGSSAPGRKNFEVTISIKEADPKNLKPGMTADAEFVCQSIAKATYVPIECVVEREGKTYVYVKNGKGFESVAVQIGAQNDNFVCINKGVKAGVTVALRDPTKSPEESDTGASIAESGEKKQKKAPAPMPGAAPEK